MQLPPIPSLPSSSSGNGSFEFRTIPFLPSSVAGGKQRFSQINSPSASPSLDQPRRTLYSVGSMLILDEEGQDQCLVIRRQLPGPDEFDTAKLTTVAELIPRHELESFLQCGIKQRKQNVESVFGVYNLSAGPYLAVVTQSKTIFVDPELGGGAELRQISEVSLWPIPPPEGSGPNIALPFDEESMEVFARAQAADLELLRLALSSHQLYFSPSLEANIDVTHALQRSLASGEGGGCDWRASDRRFFWNWGILEPLRTAAGEASSEASLGRRNRRYRNVEGMDRWITPVMSGFVDVVPRCEAGGRSFDIMFVSRRSVFRQGTRYTRRGIDSDGNVANFVETEQVLLHQDGQVTSHIQIRGSIPLFWSSPVNLRYHPPVHLKDGDGENVAALTRHVENLASHYGSGFNLVFVNLVDKKKTQGRLGEAFDDILSKTREQGGEKLGAQLEHVWFDFHEETRTKGYGHLASLLEEVDDPKSTEPHGFFHLLANGTVVSRQEGVIRTNCMDCLDRTNVVQSLIARRSLLAQLKAVGADVADIPVEPLEGVDSTALAATDEASNTATLPSWLTLPNQALERSFRNVWGNNADEMSVMYAGTPALKGDLTRTGRRTRWGLLLDGANSALRYVMNNFYDHKRQEAVDMLLGIRPPGGEAASSTGEGGGDWEGTGAAGHERRLHGWRPHLPVDLDLWAQVSAPGGVALEGSLSIGVRPRLRRKISPQQPSSEGGIVAEAPFPEPPSGLNATSSVQAEAERAEPNHTLVGPGGFYVGSGPQAQYVSMSMLALSLLCIRAASSGMPFGLTRQGIAFIVGLLFFPLIQIMRDTP
jgi:hypothetical protein